MPEVTEPLTSRGTRLIVMDGSETREEIAEKNATNTNLFHRQNLISMLYSCC